MAVPGRPGVVVAQEEGVKAAPLASALIRQRELAPEGGGGAGEEREGEEAGD